MSKSSQPTECLRLIVIDDDPEWCELLADTAEFLGHSLDTAHSLEEARHKIKISEEKQQLYSIALIDINFVSGRQRIELPRGKEAIRYIKSYHPYIACIVLSGSTITPDSVLDLRDEYDLDYYVQKDRFDLDTFARAIRNAMRRVHPDTYGSYGSSAATSYPPDVAAVDRMLPPQSERDALIRLRHTLISRFSEGELRDLCFDIGLPYHGLPGDGAADKARELVAHFERRNYVPDLITAMKRLRPDIDWDTLLF